MRTVRISAALLLVAVVLYSPFLGIPTWSPSLAVFALLWGVAATGLNLMFGYAGMLSLGNGLFLAAGAYSAGLAVRYGALSTGVGVLLGTGVTLVVSVLVGLVLTRISGVYFAVGTLGLAIAVEGFVRAFPEITGGASGLTIPRRLDLGFVEVQTPAEWYVLSAVLAVLAGLLARYFAMARTGRVLHLIRHDELSAAVLGVRVRRVKLQVFVVGSVLTSVAGTCLFIWQSVIVPESVGLIRSVELVAMTVVGGPGAWAGGFLGALLIQWLNDVARSLGDARELTYGLMFLVIALFARGGVAGVLAGARRRVLASRGQEGGDGDGGRVGPTAQSVGVPRVAAGDAGNSPDADVDLTPWTEGTSSSGLFVDDVTRAFGGVVAVSGVSLRVPPGRITALIGSNGAGKSTLMNLVSGIETPDSGRVLLGDREITDHHVAGRAALGLARTFQVPRLVPQLSVVENVALGADAVQPRVFWRRQAEESATLGRARSALTDAGIGHLADRRAAQLGSGQRKFVELVRALAWEPATLLMDEPAVGLFGAEIQLVQEWIAGLRQNDTGVLLVDHNMDFVGHVADFVYLMDQGQIIASGPPSSILRLLEGLDELNELAPSENEGQL